MNKEVCAIVVTFNRERLLIENIESLLKQTLKLKWIIIVDNNSQGYKEVKEKYFRYGRKSEFSQVILHKFKQDVEEILYDDTKETEFLYVRLNNNKGGAGGFKIGISIALETKCDWFWLLDDDVESQEDCLEKLFKYTEISECIHPRRVYYDNTECLWEGGLDIVTGLRYSLDDISFKNGKPFCVVNVGCFEGMLISRGMVERIGLPDERFFIVDDDTIYGFLASLYTNVLYVRDAVIIKKIKKLNYELEPVFVYYYLRNYKLKLQYMDEYFSKYTFVRKVFFYFSIFKFVIQTFFNKRPFLLKYIIKALIDSKKSKFGKGL
ncbi:glycosyl transferase family 2 [Caldicellulosiruptor kronotskyensis 2002]|uniref:Glycosyl transferase family 2 n=1 Tax=Caldicellulosiruptor kronotskyensis (strain DSM 18902 / VKM B-2412 / 2002) TaxID=632348 RepID=E4SCA7_CALK2|nr:glycosyltransferase [Caldicellulosiruptor kronotskyensis]ADQ44962.1 glycosyl transferase family 2 [Caldicellulosiruptor kronotskyensis 2002]